jgi:predicted membrane-bound mannosyltransferase
MIIAEIELGKMAVKMRKAIADATDTHLLKPWTLTAGSKTVLTMPRVAVVNDVPVPSIYGPSADEGNM